MCRTVAVGAGQGIQVGVSNVPGAEAYSIYLSPNGCAGPFGLALTEATNATVQDNSGSCPAIIDQAAWPASGTSGGSTGKNGCRLGYLVSPVIGAGSYSPPSGATCPALPGPSWATGLRGCAPISAARDAANQDYCTRADGVLTSCPGQASPGAVAFYFPAGARINVQGGGATIIFGGRQFANIVLFGAGTGADSINGGAATRFIGLTYLPGRDLTINGGSGDLIDGSLIVGTFSFVGGSGVVINFNPNYEPPPPGSQLIR